MTGEAATCGRCAAVQQQSRGPSTAKAARVAGRVYIVRAPHARWTTQSDCCACASSNAPSLPLVFAAQLEVEVVAGAVAEVCQPASLPASTCTREPASWHGAAAAAWQAASISVPFPCASTLPAPQRCNCPS